MEDGTVIVGKSPKMTVDFFKVAMKRAIRSIINKRILFDDMLRLAISYDYEHQTSNIESSQHYAAGLLLFEMKEHGVEYSGYRRGGGMSE